MNNERKLRRDRRYREITSEEAPFVRSVEDARRLLCPGGKKPLFMSAAQFLELQLCAPKMQPNPSIRELGDDALAGVGAPASASGTQEMLIEPALFDRDGGTVHPEPYTAAIPDDRSGHLRVEDRYPYDGGPRKKPMGTVVVLSDGRILLAGTTHIVLSAPDPRLRLMRAADAELEGVMHGGAASRAARGLRFEGKKRFDLDPMWWFRMEIAIMLQAEQRAANFDRNVLLRPQSWKRRRQRIDHHDTALRYQRTRRKRRAGICCKHNAQGSRNGSRNSWRGRYKSAQRQRRAARRWNGIASLFS